MTFSLNGGGMGRRDAAVTMQGRLGLLLSSHPAKTRFMTSRIPSYFSSWCTLWVVYLGLRALLLSPSLWGSYDLQWQHVTRGSKKGAVLLACDISYRSTTWHIFSHKYEHLYANFLLFLLKMYFAKKISNKIIYKMKGGGGERTK